ncbi:MAG: 5-formyltetrahydrofolate cyclo-ligase [Bacteroidales bacterium]|jgi:5-formyltetrahydrofolate cyclo-ligase|nr:5-formyltetrahydrofolate cyclo-ligase [Bacteroidales bacterium]
MINEQKKEVRGQIREIKKRYLPEQKKAKSESIFHQVEQMKELQEAQTIMAYWSMDDEVYTHDFVLKWYPEKNIVLPSVKGDELELREFKGLDDMLEGAAFGIKEPRKLYQEPLERIDLIIVPGVAFDKQNNRLGRGKAYYDKLLSKTRALKVGVCFDFQLLEQVPADQYDIKMDRVISG